MNIYIFQDDSALIPTGDMGGMGASALLGGDDGMCMYEYHHHHYY